MAKRLCHQIASKLYKKQLLLYSPHSLDKKKETDGRPTKMPLILVAEVLLAKHMACPYPL